MEGTSFGTLCHTTWTTSRCCHRDRYEQAMFSQIWHLLKFIQSLLIFYHLSMDLHSSTVQQFSILFYFFIVTVTKSICWTLLELLPRISKDVAIDFTCIFSCVKYIPQRRYRFKGDLSRWRHAMLRKYFSGFLLSTVSLGNILAPVKHNTTKDWHYNSVHS